MNGPTTPELELKQIEDWYRQLQIPFQVHQLDAATGRRLLESQSGESHPIHSWYVLKEACALELPPWAIQRLVHRYGLRIDKVLDPFIGCGTTGIALAERKIQVDGVEYNPFIRFVATVKSNWYRVDKKSARHFINTIANRVPPKTRLEWPELSTLHNEAYFRRDDVRYLLYVLREIDERVSCSYTRDFLRLGVAAGLESISNLRKDGRALRYIKKTNRPTAPVMVRTVWADMLTDLELASKPKGEFRVYSGSAKDLMKLGIGAAEQAEQLPNGHYDLILYSPPYLNNFDYSEIYKLELWTLGFIRDYPSWFELRKSTIRSHHSIGFDETTELRSSPATRALEAQIQALANSSCLTGYAAHTMPSVISGYFDDMYVALREQFRVLRPGGFLVFVVANSRHSSLPIATDVILAAIANQIGFEPLELVVLKKRNGRTRQKNFLRESAVIMRKPTDRVLMNDNAHHQIGVRRPPCLY